MAVVHQQARQLVLRAVRVLVLVHHHIIKLMLVLVAHVRALRQQLNRHQQQVVKVHRIVLEQAFFVLRKHLCHLALVKIARLARVLARPHHRVLRITDCPQHCARLKALFVQVVFLQNMLHQRLLVARVVNRKIALVRPQRLDLLLQQARAKAMKRVQPHTPRPRAHQLVHALAHFLGRLVRKRNSQNAERGIAQVQQMRNAARQHLRLAAARASQNQHRPFCRQHRVALLRVQGR